MIRVIENKVAIIQIPAADWDVTNTLRCRWASGTGLAGNECDDICGNLPNANISSRFFSFYEVVILFLIII